MKTHAVMLSISMAVSGCVTPCLERELSLNSRDGIVVADGYGLDAVVVIADDYAFIADRICSDAECWSETKLVRHNARVHPPRIFDQVGVPELGTVALVHAACWVSDDEVGFFRARVSSRSEPTTSYVARLTPNADGSYLISREEP
jgi:hypothetical protein